jgi:hypothetical protein
MTSFSELGLIAPLMRAARPPRHRPDRHRQDRRLRPADPAAASAAAPTGRVHRRPRHALLVLTPTRELASQIGESFAAYGATCGCATP